jgi:hypothetical protein
MITERDIVRGLVDGRLPSPAVFLNNTFCLLRLASAGVFVRGDALAYKDRADWLSNETCLRLVGTPITADNRTKLDIASYVPGCIRGTIVHAYVADDRLMAVARLWGTQPEPQAARLHVRDGDADVVQLDDDTGTRLTLENAPAFVSHVAIS